MRYADVASAPLRSLRRRSRLRLSDLADRVNQIVGAAPKGRLAEPVLWRVWRSFSGAGLRYVVVYREDLIIIPGGSSARVRLLDGGGKRIGSWCFQTGWRTEIAGASFSYSGDLGSDVLELDMDPVINGRNIAKEYFCIDKDRIRLVRLQNDRGQIGQNEYAPPNYEIGVAPEARTIDQWSDLLESADRADVLSALVFLGGRHVSDGRRRMLNVPESRFASLFTRLMNDGSIRKLISDLAHSDSEWIRQAASLAARSPWERPFQ